MSSQTDSEAQADQATANRVEDSAAGHPEPPPPPPPLNQLAPGAEPFPPSVQLDRDIIYSALCRLSRLQGGPMVGEHTGDVEMRNLSPEFVAVVEWARTKR
jgi:hypothetical protein